MRDPGLAGLQEFDPLDFNRIVRRLVKRQTPIRKTGFRSLKRVMFRLVAPIAALAGIALIVLGLIPGLDFAQMLGWILLVATTAASILVGALIGLVNLYRRLSDKPPPLPGAAPPDRPADSFATRHDE